MKTRSKRAFTLVELALVVTLIGLLAAIGVPYVVKARGTSQANACINNLGILAGAIEIYSRETKSPGGNPVTLANIQPYLSFSCRGTLPVCPANGIYSVDYISNNPKCTISGHTLP